MKYLAIIFLFVGTVSFSQDIKFTLDGELCSNQLPHRHRWVPDSIGLTEWIPIDTIGVVNSDKREWVFTEERQLKPTLKPHLEWGWSKLDEWEELRICLLTGIVERRKRFMRYRLF